MSQGPRSGRYEHGEKYMENLTLRSKKLNENTRENLNSLPKLYAKAAALNRKLSLTPSTRLAFNEDDLNSSNHHFDENTYDIPQNNNNNNGFEPPKSNKNDQDDLYLKEYKKARKKSMIVSNCLDDDLKLHLEHLKYGDFSTKASRDKGRRHSMIDFELIERLKKASSHHFGLNEENEDDLSNTSGSNEFQSSSKEEYLNEMKSKTPGFASHLSKEGQYALLKSLEDTITTEIEINHPELRDKITRTSTAKYGRRGSIASEPNDKSLFHSNNELENQFIVTQQIETAMELLDELRRKKSILVKKQIQFNEQTTAHENIEPHLEASKDRKSTMGKTSRQGNVGSQAFRDAVKLPNNTHRKSIVSNSSQDLINTPSYTNITTNANTTNAKLMDLLAKYSQWKNMWMSQLNNV